MYSSTLLTTLTTLLFLLVLPLQTQSAAIRPRDNACTACLETIRLATLIPDILSCGVSDNDKQKAMHEQVCSQLNQTALFGFCEAYVDMWSPQLYQYFAVNSTDPKVVCADEKFRAC